MSRAVWHVPQLYDAAAAERVRSTSSSTSASSSAALVFWGALLDAPPVRARIDHLRRAGWFVAAMFPMWILALMLAFATAPVYAATHR